MWFKLRQHMPLVALVVGVIAMGGCRQQSTPVRDDTPGLALPDTIPAPAPRVVDAHLLETGGPAIAGRFAPDGQRIVVTGPGYVGLRVVDRLGGQVRVLDAERRVGYNARFVGETVLARDAAGETVRFPVAGTAVGEVVSEPVPRDVKGRAWLVREDRIWWERDGESTAVTGDDDRYFGAHLSPDGRRLVYQGLHSGLYLRDLESGRTAHVGSGNHPAWLSDSSGFLFDQSTDDGLRVVASELYLLRVSDLERIRLTDTPQRHEMRPEPSPDGRYVLFEADERLFIGRLER